MTELSDTEYAMLAKLFRTLIDAKWVDEESRGIFCAKVYEKDCEREDWPHVFKPHTHEVGCPNCAEPR